MISLPCPFSDPLRGALTAAAAFLLAGAGAILPAADAKPWWDFLVQRHDLLLAHAQADGEAPPWLERAGTDRRETMAIDGLPRTWDLHLPPAFDGTTPLPLMIALHGGGLSGMVHEYYSGLSDLADQEGFIVAYPDAGVPGPASGGPLKKYGWDGQLNSPGDDVDFIRALLTRLRTTLPIAPGEVMVCGLSSGAIMSYRFALEAGDQIDCIGSVSGTYIWNLRDGAPKPMATPVARMSVVAFHGQKDKSVPYDGIENERVRLWPAPRSVGFWTAFDGYTGDPVAEHQPGLLKQTWSGNANGTEVWFYTLAEAGHDVPLSPGDPGIIHASEVMWNFLSRNQACLPPAVRAFSGPGMTVARALNPRLPDATLRYSVDGSAPGNAAPVLPANLDLTASTTLRVAAFSHDQPVGVATTARFQRLEPAPAQALAAPLPGLRFAYGEGDWAAVPDLADLHPTATGVCTVPALTGVAHRSEHFAIRFDGFLNIPVAGVYTLSVQSDDGSFLRIDGVRVIDNDGLHALLERSRRMALAAGWHAIGIGYLQGTGDCALAVSLAGPGLAKRPLTAQDVAHQP